jgi:antitoxin component YwqK of YwqJK toxin-antitoxin module
MANGQPNGTWTYFYPNGKIQATGKMENGKRIGLWKYFLKNGQLAEESTHKWDKILNTIYYDSAGKPIEGRNGPLQGE